MVLSAFHGKPKAGTSLWCPCCPDDFVGKWTGSVSKSSALLRHAAAASQTGIEEAARALVA